MVLAKSNDTEQLPSIDSLLPADYFAPKDQELFAHCNGPSSYHGHVAPNGTQPHGMSALSASSSTRPRRTAGHHRSSHSVSSLPVELQNLSLQGPAQQQQPPPAAAAPALFPPLAGSSLPPPLHFFAAADDRTTTRRSGRNAAASHHVRSRSELSQPFVAHLAAHRHQHYPLVPQPSRHSHHRRAASANTVDLMLNGHMPQKSRAVSHSPPLTQQGNELVLQDNSNNGKKATGATTSNSNGNDRYVCQYCMKAFSRPSSLRIHIYSHTGEKPFACPEPDCGRKFSVQSNMRRHLRVHRVGRPDKQTHTTTTTHIH